MPLPNFTLSPKVKVAILTLQEDECDEYEDVFTIILKWKAELWKIRRVKTEAMAHNQRNPNTVDNRMGELMSTLIHCHP